MSSTYKFLAATSCALLVSCGSEEAPTSTATPAPEPAATESVAANTAAATATPAAPELGSFGIDRSHQDANIQPGDDFFRYTNGRWLETFELPASRSNYGSFAVLGDRSDQRVRTIVARQQVIAQIAEDQVRAAVTTDGVVERSALDILDTTDGEGQLARVRRPDEQIQVQRQHQRRNIPRVRPRPARSVVVLLFAILLPTVPAAAEPTAHAPSSRARRNWRCRRRDRRARRPRGSAGGSTPTETP